MPHDLSPRTAPRMSRRAWLATLGATGLAACTRVTGERAEAAGPTSSGVSAVASPTQTASPSPAPAYPGLGIEALRQERWGADGSIETVGELTGEAGFRRYRIRYLADGIPVDGFMNVPAGPGPFPVVIVCHGYVPVDSYELLTYTTEHADAFARAGYLVLHPSYRNHRGSGNDNNDYRVGYGRDVMHLVGLARRLPQADGEKVALWGHSMGGPPVFRALAVMPEQIACAVAYGAMSPFEADNWRYIIDKRRATGTTGPAPEPTSPEESPDLYAAVSPGNYWQGLRVPVQIHHGELDEQVDVEWSRRLDRQLTELGTPHGLFLYPGGPHNLVGAPKEQVWSRCLELFAREMG